MAGVMIGAGGGGALQTLPELFNKLYAERSHARVLHAFNQLRERDLFYKRILPPLCV